MGEPRSYLQDLCYAVLWDTEVLPAPQVLTDISNHRHLAKYVHTVAISVENFGLVDLLHEEVAKQNAQVHPKSTMPPLGLEELGCTRTRLYSATLAQAFERLPHMKRVLLGAAPRLD